MRVSRNLIVLGAPLKECEGECQKLEPTSDEIVTACSLGGTARILFVSTVKQVKDGISWQKNEHYPDLTQIWVAKDSVDALLSVIFAKLKPGIETELVALREIDDISILLDRLSKIPHRTILDSAAFAGGVNAAWALAESSKESVDLSWLRFAEWREELTKAMLRPRVQNSLSHLQQIEIRLTIGSQGFLILGWLLANLNLDVTAKGHDSFECRFTEGPTEGSIVNIKMIFDSQDSSKHSSNEISQVKLHLPSE